MIVYFILLFIIVISIIVIAVIIFNKLTVLKSIDLAAMKQHQQQQIKVSLVEERIERKLKEAGKKISTKSAPLLFKSKTVIRNFYQKLHNLQKKYKDQANQKKGVQAQDKEVIRQKINSLLVQAQELIKQNKYSDSEKKYIEAISLNSQNLDSYKGLADLYLLNKDYQHALETLKFIEQINSQDEGIWRQLGSVQEALNNLSEAVKCYKKASDLVPNNPKNLDLLLDISIKAKDTFLAKTTLSKLKEVNPENQKLASYQKTIEELK